MLTRRWNKEEIAILNRYYPLRGALGIQYYIKDRSIKKIREKAMELKIRYVAPYERARIYEKQIIQDHLDGNSISKICQNYGLGRRVVVRIFKANKLKARHCNHYRKMSYDKNYFDEINSHEKAYWLGFIGADGNLFKNRLSLCCIDKGHLDKFKKAIDGRQNICHSKGIIYKYAIANEDIRKQMLKLGIAERKSTIHPFPNSKQVPHEFLNSYILGYFDGDGCIYYRKTKWGFTWQFSIIASPCFARDCLNSLCQSFDFRPTKLRDAPPMKYVMFGGAYQGRLAVIYNYLYKDIPKHIPLSRKRDKFEFLLTHCRTKEERAAKKVAEEA